MQVPASWGFNRLDEEKATELYDKVNSQLSTGMMPLRTLHADAVLESNALFGLKEVSSEEVGSNDWHSVGPLFLVAVGHSCWVLRACLLGI